MGSKDARPQQLHTGPRTGRRIFWSHTSYSRIKDCKQNSRGQMRRLLAHGIAGGNQSDTRSARNHVGDARRATAWQRHALSPHRSIYLMLLHAWLPGSRVLPVRAVPDTLPLPLTCLLCKNYWTRVSSGHTTLQVLFSRPSMRVWTLFRAP